MKKRSGGAAERCGGAAEWGGRAEPVRAGVWYAPAEVIAAHQRRI